jgi:hypothetical protein
MPVQFPLSPLKSDLKANTTAVGVHGFKDSRFHSRPWTAFGMRIYEKSVSFVRHNPKFGANWQLFGKMSIFNEDFGSLMPSLSLTLNVEP